MPPTSVTRTASKATSLEAVTDRLVAAGCVAAPREASELLASAPDEVTLDAWVRRREQGEPLPWITGTVEFCGRRLHVAPGTYVPRPQSEELARRAATHLPEHGRAIDLCTGVGGVAAHLAAQVPTATVFGVDIDVRSAICARRNGVQAVAADLAVPFRRGARVDLVTAVAPYVPTDEMRLLSADVQRYESRVALDGGTDGLDVIRRVIGVAAHCLLPEGWLLVEVGGEQDEALASTFERARFDAVIPWRDEDGDLRGVAARRAA